jgi:predicted transporter
VEPFRNLPGGGDLELTWTPVQNLLGAVTLLLGTAFLVAALVVALRRAPEPAPTSPVEHPRNDLAAGQPVREVRP